MVLVDTSVWVLHLRKTHPALIYLLEEGEVACHPFVIGELACGNLKNRSTIISLLKALPAALVVGHEEILPFIENNRLMGEGLGYVDIHLLASAVLTVVPLWTLARKLQKAAELLHVLHRQNRR